MREIRDLQFPLDKSFDVIEIHARARVPGAKGVQSRAIAVLIQAGQYFLAGFCCEVGLSEAAAGYPLLRKARNGMCPTSLRVGDLRDERRIPCEKLLKFAVGYGIR